MPKIRRWWTKTLDLGPSFGQDVPVWWWSQNLLPRIKKPFVWENEQNEETEYCYRPLVSLARCVGKDGEDAETRPDLVMCFRWETSETSLEIFVWCNMQPAFVDKATQWIPSCHTLEGLVERRPTLRLELAPTYLLSRRNPWTYGPKSKTFSCFNVSAS